jgi:prepilin signal peptidase PulO-like enzyme (type II secretory pathway)
MDILIFIFIFCLGAIIGSFLNVVIFRLNSGKTLGGRSMCMTCSKTLSWYELIPVISFLFQKGKCNTCATKISHQYPWVEFITALVFTLIAWHFYPILLFSFSQYLLLLFTFSAIFSILIVISVYDMRHKIIPDQMVIAFAVLSFFSMFLSKEISGSMFVLPDLYDYLSGPLYSLPFVFMFLVSGGRWMGLGDAKLAFGMGWLLGIVFTASALIISFWLGAIFGIFLLYLSKKKFTSNTEIPFGPFLAISTFIVFLYSVTIVDIASIFFN